MALSFIATRKANNNVSYNVMLDTESNQFNVVSISGAIMFKAESESLALYGIRCIGRVDVFGLLITDGGFKHYNGKPYLNA